MTSIPVSPLPDVLVVCLCAQWCGVCRDYRERFAQVRSRHPEAAFLWIDVEDEADLLHPLDVENFPTVLLAVGDEPRFFGTLTPQWETLDRLIRTQVQDAGHKPLVDADLVEAVARIRADRLR